MPPTSNSPPAPSHCNGPRGRYASAHWRSNRSRTRLTATERPDDLHTIVGGQWRLQCSHHCLSDKQGDVATDRALLVDYPESHTPIASLQLVYDIIQHQRPVVWRRQIQGQFAQAARVVIQLAGKHDPDHGEVTTSTE